LDYQREKSEITTDLDKIEMGHQRDVRDLKDKVTECESGAREARTESQRIVGQMKREEGDHNSKIEDLGIEKT
jgi:hypothetical protein